MKILILSDIHLDLYPKAEEIIHNQIENTNFDALLCTGDISNKAKITSQFLHKYKDIPQPKYFVPGNHDLWAFPRYHELYQILQQNNWHAPIPGQAYTQIDNILLYNIFYTPQPTWNNDKTYTNDRFYFTVDHYTHRQIRTPEITQPIKWSASHLIPHPDLTPEQPKHYLLHNPVIHALNTKHKIPHHIYGHSHTPNKQQIYHTTYHNKTFLDRKYNYSQNKPRTINIE